MDNNLSTNIEININVPKGTILRSMLFSNIYLIIHLIYYGMTIMCYVNETVTIDKTWERAEIIMNYYLLC